MRTIVRRSLPLALCVLAWICAPALAQDEPPPGKTLEVALSPISPFVVQEKDGSLSGFDVELWKEIAEDLNVKATFRKPTDFKAMLAAVESGGAAVGLGAITITAEREKRLDFSHQYIESGLRIMVPVQKRSALSLIASNLFQAKNLAWLAGGLGFIAISALLCWWSERGNEEAFSDSFYPGFFQAVYWTVVTMSTVGYGDYAPRRPLGRLMAVLVIFSGISVYGTLIAKGASALTVDSLQSSIQGPQDLGGKKVATVQGTTSEEVLARYGASVQGVTDIHDAYAMLNEGKVDAVVFDAPSLLHYAHSEGAGKVHLAGEPFEIQYYGFAFPEGSPLRERVNRSLLRLRSNGVYEKLHARYFGS